MLNKLCKICETKTNVNLKTMCSMHIGGIGKYVCFPSTVKQLKKLIKFLNKNNTQYFVVGNGTNVVFEDGGFSAVLICLKKMNVVKLKKNMIIAHAGANLFKVNGICKKHGLSGLEWSYGIPGSVGGAVFMNAGANGFEIKDIVLFVWVLTGGKIKKIKAQNMGFCYRGSTCKKNGYVVLRASFKLKKESVMLVEQKQNQFLNSRKALQPYGTFNAGSVFKKTDFGSAGKIIDKLGLKNVKIGQIQISPKHANFFVNLGNGTSHQLHQLIDYTKQMVYKKMGIVLEEEIIFVKDEGK